MIKVVAVHYAMCPILQRGASIESKEYAAVRSTDFRATDGIPPKM
jgi:hypothetical protein